MNMLTGFGQYEREMASDRIRDKIGASKKKGIWMGGVPPLGYKVKDRALHSDKTEAALIRLIFQRFLVLRSIRKVLEELKEQGYKTRLTLRGGKQLGGTDFTFNNIHHILSNPTYKGYVKYKEALYIGQHKAIIPEKLWEEVQAVFAVNPHTRASESRTASPALLKHVIRCRACDASMRPTYTKKKHKTFYYYTCDNHLRRKTCQAAHRTLPAGDIENFITAKIRMLLTSPEIITKSLHKLEEAGIKEEEALHHLQTIEQMWDSLFPVERQRITKLLIHKIHVKDDGIEVCMEATGLNRLLHYTGLNIRIEKETA